MCEVKNNGYTCKSCGKRVTFSPSLKERGMTNQEAKSIFYDGKAGMCTDCFIEYRSKK